MGKGKAKKIAAITAVLAAGAAGIAYAIKKDKEDKEVADFLNKLNFKKCTHTEIKKKPEKKDENPCENKDTGSEIEVNNDTDTTTSVEESDVKDNIDYEKETRDVIRKINAVLKASGLGEEDCDCEKCCSECLCDCHKDGDNTDETEED